MTEFIGPNRIGSNSDGYPIVLENLPIETQIAKAYARVQNYFSVV